MKKTTFLLMFFVSYLAVFPLDAAVKARYVRVDNPTGLGMECMELEVYSGGENIIRDKADRVRGTCYPQPGNDRPTRENTIVAGSREARELVDGVKDTSYRSSEWMTFRPSNGAYLWNSWFEVDLGEEVEIEKVVYYASNYPNRKYVDKGHRTICVMDAGRKIEWAVHWQYYDTGKYPDGVFSFDIEEQTKKTLPFKGLHVPVDAFDWVPMSWLLEADAESIPPDAGRRMTRFENRHSDMEIEKLAKDFFTILDEKTPGLEKAFELYRSGKYRDALDAWKTFWFAKMERVNQFQALNFNKSYSACGDDLLDGLMVTIMSNEVRAIRYTPGRIHWIIVPEDRDDPDFRKKLSQALADEERKACIGSTCWPLLYSYRNNPDEKYVRRWAEIMDDWSLNFFVDSAAVPYEVENLFTFSPGHDWCQMMEDLSIIAGERPSLVEHIPSPTLARAQMIALEKYTTAWWRQARETNFNHNTGGFYAYEPILFYIDEFHPGRRAAKEWRENLERFVVLGNFRDGSLTEIGDEGHMEIPTLMNVIAGRVEKYKPDWYTPGWRNHYFEWADKMYFYMYRHLAPGGYEHRDRPDYRTYRWTSTTEPYWKGRPSLAPDRDEEILGEPEMRRMLGVWGFVSVDLPKAGTVDGTIDGSDETAYPEDVIEHRWKPVQKTMREFFGDEIPDKPALNSDWMPYYGGYYFRGGWKLDDPFVHMVACGASGGGQPFLYPYGMYYLYDHNFPLFFSEPLRVKNYLPLQIHGKEHRWQPGTKTAFLVGSDENPADFRWSSTERFDFGEAIFEGAYGNFPHFRGDWDDTSLEMAPLPEAVENIRTVRQIVHLRKQRLFLVVDRVQGNTEGHELSIQYKIALSSKKDEPFDGAKQLRFEPREGEDEARTSGVIRSENPLGPSLSVHHFADRPFSYRLEREAQPDFGRYSCRLGGQTGIAEPTVRMLTKADSLTSVGLLASRKPGGVERIVSIEPLDESFANIVGFNAQLDDGTKISCQLAGKGCNEKLFHAGIGASSEMLVVVTEKNKKPYGIVLGADLLVAYAHKGPPPYPDFEFRAASGVGEGRGDTIRSTPIFRPIKPVVFKPDRNVFSDTETVEMICDTPDVEIRYTTDGTPPGRDSTLYTGPVRITETTEFAARAYRLRNGKPIPEVAEDFELNGTKFTVPSFAFYRKTESRDPVDVSKSDLKPGLVYEYFEAPWWRLYASAHWLAAEKTGVAKRELDLSDVSTNKAYCMRYKGYIEIPEDGVYTFHAPEEIADMVGAASYDLRLYIDEEEWSLSQFWHAHGTWSVPLQKGMHRFQVDFADSRTKPWNRSGIWRFYPRPWAEHQGPPSDIMISGPGVERARIPEKWFYADKTDASVDR